MEFRILGPLEIVDGERRVSLGGAKQRGLLALLLLNANETVAADRLIDELWGEQSPDSARAALQVRVSQLRKTLGRMGETLLTRAPGYMLRVEPGQLDLHRFERLLAEADESDPGLAADRLREALGLWRGPPLADLSYEPFAQPAIRRLDELRLTALERRIEADLELGRHAELVAELQALVGEHPLRERLRGQLMLALYRCGRQAEALSAFQEMRRGLVEQLGIEPSPPLRELESAILRQDRTLEVAVTPEIEHCVLVVGLHDGALEALLAIAAPLATRAGTEVVVARPIRDRARLTAETAALQARREGLLRDGIPSRVAAFTSADPGRDAARMAVELESDLLLVDAPAEVLESLELLPILADAPCDVAALIGAAPAAGPLLVPFVGAEHDWTAIELGAGLARSWQTPLRLAGPLADGRDASRLLASASLAVQRAYGVAAEPLLVAPDSDELVRACGDAALVILGLGDRWRCEGLGAVRGALTRQALSPTLLVRRGVRPGPLSPTASRTRFTWSLSFRGA